MRIVEFLRARLDEDEGKAREAIGDEGTGDWRPLYSTNPDGELELIMVVDTDGCEDLSVVSQLREVVDGEVIRMRVNEFAHIARHDPARVLREVEAKRDIVAAAVYWLDHGESSESALQAQQALESLASVYADHPDYDPEWSQ